MSMLSQISPYVAIPTRCNQCKAIFGSITACEQHVKDTGHEHQPAFFCIRPSCSATFDSLKKRKKHLTNWGHGVPEGVTPSNAYSPSPGTASTSAPAVLPTSGGPSSASTSLSTAPVSTA